MSISDEVLEKAKVAVYLAMEESVADQMSAIISELLDARQKIRMAEEALEFYAGDADDAFWEDNRFICIGKFGQIETEACGPLVAKQALAILRGIKGDE